MQLNPDQADRLCVSLRTTKPFASLPVMNQPTAAVWSALNDTLLALRRPLYHHYLHKPPPKPADRAQAIQAGLALIGAFAALFGTRQAIVSSHHCRIDRISFQPRPEGMNWTGEHAIAPPALVHRASIRQYDVSLEDFLHLSAKVVYAVTDRHAGAMPDATATYTFGATDDTIMVALSVREHANGTYRIALLEA